MAVAADIRISCKVTVLLVVIAVAAFAAPARADEAEAERAFDEGRELLERGAYAAACEAFAHSQRLDPAPGTLLNLGLCHKRLGHVATSYATFRAAADLAARENDDTRRRVAQEQAEALEPRLSKLQIELDFEPPPGLEVAKDGKDMTSKLGAAHPVDPGHYEIEAAAPGRKAWQRTVSISEEGVTEIVTIPELEEKREQAEAGIEASEIEREPAPDGDGASAPDLDSSRPLGSEHEPGRGLRIGGMTTTGAGVAAAATGLAFGLRAQATWRRSQDHCDENNVCSHRGIELAARAERSADISTLLVGAGIAAAATGAILWLNAPSSESASPSPSARLVPAASGMGVSLRGRF